MYKSSLLLLENLLGFVSEYGFVPNGNRKYYLNRSQPPLLTLMVDIYVKATGNEAFMKENFHLLEREYLYWNDVKSKHRVMVENSKGKRFYLNRYFVETKTPRCESWCQVFFFN